MSTSLALTRGQTTHAVAAQLGHASFSTTARHYADPSAMDNARIRGFVKKLRGGSGSLAGTFKELSAEEKQQLRALLAEDDNKREYLVSLWPWPSLKYRDESAGLGRLRQPLHMAGAQ